MPESVTHRPPTAAPRQAPAVIAAHWATALVLLAVFALVLAHERFDDTLWRQALMQGHRWAGLLVWALAVARKTRGARPSSAPKHVWSRRKAQP